MTSFTALCCVYIHMYMDINVQHIVHIVVQYTLHSSCLHVYALVMMDEYDSDAMTIKACLVI